MVPRPLSHTSAMPAYWQAERPAELDRDTGDGAEYGLPKPDECCLAFNRSVAMLEVIAVHGSACVRWYIEYGLAAPVYGHGVPAVGAAPDVIPMPLANIPLEFIFTDGDVELKQFTEF